MHRPLHPHPHGVVRTKQWNRNPRRQEGVTYHRSNILDDNKSRKRRRWNAAGCGAGAELLLLMELYSFFLLSNMRCNVLYLLANYRRFATQKRTKHYKLYTFNFRFLKFGFVCSSIVPSDLKRGNFQSPVNAMGLRPVISVLPISSHFGIAGRGTGLSGLCLTFCCGGLNLPRCTGSTRICRACTFVATHTLTGDGACCACVLSPNASLRPRVYFSQRMIE